MVEGPIRWLAYTVESESLMREIIDATTRISDLVGAAKQYSQLDRAPFRYVDVHEGLDATLVMFGRKLGEGSGVKIVKEYDTPDWSPDQAQTEMDQAITALGKTGFKGVYAMNDGTAGGAIAAMQAAGVDPKTIPTTGQDRKQFERTFGPLYILDAPGGGACCAPRA